MEDEPRGFVGALNVGKRRGRGEDWLAAQLVRRGHTVVQQYPVWKHDGIGRYYIDIAIGRVAVELYSYWQAPWENADLKARTRRLLLNGWRVLYVWMDVGQTPTAGVVDAVLQFVIDADARTQHGYRAVNHEGALLRIGWLDEADELTIGEPDVEPAWPDDDWTPEPPVPPSEEPDEWTVQWQRSRPNPRTLEQNNELRRQWYEYNLAFDAWEAERQRRRKPWEELERVQRAGSRFRP